MRVTRELYALAPRAALSSPSHSSSACQLLFHRAIRGGNLQGGPEGGRRIDFTRHTRPSCRWIYNGLLGGEEYPFCAP